jgi:hypothetical protein
MHMTLDTRRLRYLLVAMLALIVGAGVYAFTATNTVNNSAVGSGSQVISGYTISNISYHLNAADPSKLDSVTFDMAPTTATVVKIKLTAAGPWYSCVNSSGSATCDTTSPQADPASPDQLTVVATD